MNEYDLDKQNPNHVVQGIPVTAPAPVAPVEPEAPVMPVNKNIMNFTSKSGKVYVFQKVAPMGWLDIMDDVDNNSDRKRRTLYVAVMENIVVQPKMSVEQFTDYAELEEVVTAATKFQRGQ